MLNLGVETQSIASLPFYTEQARETQSIASLPFYAEQALRRNALRLYRFTPEQARETQSIASLPFYAEHVTRPSSIEQLGPAGISSTICSTSPP